MQKNLYSDILTIVTPYVKKHQDRVAQAIHDQIMNIYRKQIIESIKHMTEEQIIKMGYKKNEPVNPNSNSNIIVP